MRFNGEYALNAVFLNSESQMNFHWPQFQRVRKTGIAIEKHFVTTEDGYILGLYHLVRPSNTSELTAPKPILFMHGLISSSLDFVVYPNNSAGN